MKKFATIILVLSITAAFGQTVNNWQVGNTSYDLQTNRSNQNRIYVFPDGSIGATWNFGMDYPNFGDLSAAYNYYNGSEWLEMPEFPVSGKNPSYTRLGTNGEIIVCEVGSGLRAATRANKGAGEWQVSTFSPPAGSPDLYSPLVFTSGADNTVIHLLYMKKVEWPGIDPPNNCRVLYARSTDNGSSWDILHHEFESLGPDYYYGFSEQAIAVASPVGENLAFVVGDYYTDMLLLISQDNGDTWMTNKIWNHPYDFFLVENGDVPYFYCQDGSCTLAIDEQGIAHAVFGVSRIKVADGELAHFNAMGALAHWKEGMPAFPATENSLDPDTLAASGNLIRQYTHDFFVKPAYNSLGMATMPSMSIEGDNITVVYSLLGGPMGSETNNHIWAIQSMDNGNTWLPEIDLNSALIYLFDECIYPSIAPFSYMNRWALVFQSDWQAGLAVNGQHMFDDNYIHVFQFEKACFPEQITVDFEADETTINEGDTVYFTNLTESCPSPQWFDWSFEGGTPETSDELHPVVVYDTPGTYFVSLHSYNGSQYGNKVKQNYIEVLPTMGISGKSKERPFIIDVSNTGQITINGIGSPTETTEIWLTDLTGRIIYHSAIQEKTHRFPIESSGMYMLVIQSDQVSFSEKIIIR